MSNVVIKINKRPLNLGAGIVVPPDVLDKGFWKIAIAYQFLYSVLGLVTGLACELMGTILFIGGITGTGHWTATLFGIQITDAAPGVVLFIMGVAAWQFTKFDISVEAVPADPTPVVKDSKADYYGDAA